jgi:hypothetical protein
MTPPGDEFDNMAVYVGHIRPDGVVDRLWTVDLDSEAVEAFWERNPRFAGALSPAHVTETSPRTPAPRRRLG